MSINEVDVSKIVVSNRVPFARKDFKYLIGYKVGKKFRPLCVMLPKLSAYRRDFDETKYMSFLKNYELLEKYNEIWEKASKAVKKRFNSKSVYDDKYLKN